jgi:hypothetical protein
MEADKERFLFLQLVTMFHAAAMQYMGKVHNPATGKAERDLAQAQLMIDLLDMLQRKTSGQLANEESSFLGNVLQELKLNFVDESSKPEPPKESS